MKVDTILAAGDWPSLPDEARRLEEAGIAQPRPLRPDRRSARR